MQAVERVHHKKERLVGAHASKMVGAYQQISLNANSRKFVVINTHKGLFRYTRLPYGIASAPGIFQKAMEQLLQGIAGIAVYIDDILVTGGDEDEHLKSLEEVLKRIALPHSPEHVNVHGPTV